jgi:membrane protease YdiL (CAAX protease family)
MIKWKVKSYWYLMIPLLAVLLVLPALLIGLLGNLIDFSLSYFTVELALTFFLFQLISSGLEEPGWRGYLLPKLLEEYTAEQASVRLGILWSIWHWPFVIYFTLTTSDIAAGEPDRELVMFLLVVQTLFFFTLSTVGISFIYTWIYVNTKSVFLAIFFHAFENFSSTYFQSISSPVLSVVLGASPWLIAAFLLKKYDKETLLIDPPKKIVAPAVAMA